MKQSNQVLPNILDNRENGVVGEFLKNKIQPSADIRVVSAYFSIYAHQALSESLGQTKEFKFLFGVPRSVGNVATGESEIKRFLIGEDGDMEPAITLQQQFAAQQCVQWVKRKDVHIRTMRNEFLHGKMFHISNSDQAHAVCGSANFTAHGLGFGRGNRELNIITDNETTDNLRAWFDALWNNPELLQDAKQDVLNILSQLGKNQSPEFIYFLTLFRLFHKELDAAEREADNLKLEDSEIWHKLYSFQQEAVFGILRRLIRWRCCILADSVGLGKTYTALAVIKYFQNERVLVLCPKRLEQNWTQFLYDAQGRNPLEADQFNYRIHAHTDLSRDNMPDWSKYDLVVIDESHNFRNATGARFKTLRSAMRSGSKTKILMLSATPVNTSLKDIRNQISLAVDDKDFRQELGIASIEETVRRAQEGFNQWEQDGGKDKDALMEKLGGEFMKLSDAVTIARNRRHVKEYYTDDSALNKIAKKPDDFPERRKPEKHSPATDSEEILSYEDIHSKIGEFGLSIYMPVAYLKSDSPLLDELEAEDVQFKQTQREHYLIGMIRINFLKRLESSVHSFCQTMDRTIKKIQVVEDKIARLQQGETESHIEIDESSLEPDEYAEDDDFIIGKKIRYDLRQMKVEEWSRDLKRDRETLQEVLNRARTVTSDRDAKLAKLKEILRDKAQNPAQDKDGNPNRKALVFTAFSDTVVYLYDQLRDFARDELGLHIAMVEGSGERNKTTAAIGRHPSEDGDHTAKHSDILDHFAPRARGLPETETKIDILIATDCISEGQNLQDCDMVVNYDIHWNPVRVIQRFGRIDRIGGRNREVRRVDFWPHMDLDEYLNLEARVLARMALVSAVAAGDDDPKSEATRETEFRDQQLRRLREEALTIDDLDGVSLSDFTMADCLTELRHFLQNRKEELEKAPDGLFAVVKAKPDIGAEPGIIFCLRQKFSESEGDANNRKSQNPTHPYFLTYVRQGKEGQEVRFGFPQAKPILRMFGDLCRGETTPLDELCSLFDKETANGENMSAVNAALDAAIKGIVGKFHEKIQLDLTTDRAVKIPKKTEQPKQATDFELVSWLVIR